MALSCSYYVVISSICALFWKPDVPCNLVSPWLHPILNDVPRKDGIVDKVRRLPYLRACLNKSLRITPPFSYNLPRRMPPECAIILGSFVTGNTTVFMSSYVAHHDVEIFRDPESFVPDRWLDEGARELQPYFVPFSTDARGCIGRKISYMKQTVMLATLVHRYELALPYPKWDQRRVEVTNLLPGPMPLKVWRRNLL